jgi:hypothetical protein
LGETDFLDTAASDGTAASSLVERRIWSIGRGEPKRSEKILSQCQFIYHKYHIGYSEVEAKTLG